MITVKQQRLQVILASLPRMIGKQGKEYADWEAKETAKALRGYPPENQSGYTKHQLTETRLDMLLGHFLAITIKHQKPIPAHLRFNPLTDKLVDMADVQHHFKDGEFSKLMKEKGIVSVG